MIGYLYRNRAKHINYYPDAIPQNLSENATFLLFMIAEVMNDENMLVVRMKRKSKFSPVVYEPLTKEEIRERMRYRFGVNKFDSAWSELNKHCLKRIRYYNFQAFAVNPAVISKCRYVPFWLYDEFQDYMNPYLSANAINKLQKKLHELYY